MSAACTHCGVDFQFHDDANCERIRQAKQPQPPATSEEHCARCHQPRFTCVCTPEELDNFHETPAWETPSHEDIPVSEPRPAPDEAEPEPIKLTRHRLMAATASDPERLQFFQSLVPPDLVDQKRWIGWKAVLEEGKSKVSKKPYSPLDGSAIGAVTKNQHHFLTFAEAYCGIVKHELDGIGYVFCEEDGLVGIDFDNCVIDGKIHPVVQFWLKLFDNTYAEFSPSCTGIHIIAKGRIPKVVGNTDLPDATGEKATGVKVEMYKGKRFLTWTTLRFLSSECRLNETLAIANCQGALDKLFRDVRRKVTDAEPQDASQHEDRLLSLREIRRIHAANLQALRCAREGEGNKLLNNAAFFAGRAIAVKALEQTEEQVTNELLHIVREEWSRPYPEGEAHAVIRAGLQSGAEKQPPLSVLSIPEDALGLITQRETVAWFNERFFIVEDYGNKCRVCWLEADPNFNNRITLGSQSQREFSSRYNHLKIKIAYTGKDGKEKKISVPIAECWLDYRWRRQTKTVVFAPGEHSDEHQAINLWTGFAVKPRAGDCSLFLEFVRNVICSGNDQHFRWVVNWLAYAVQHPGERGHVALVLRGKKGTGKSFFAEAFGHLWGAHFLPLIHPEHVAGRFNVHLRTCSVLFANEALFAGSHQHESMLKAIITDPSLPIEEKFVNVMMAPNRTHVIIAGNADWLIRASADERRFLVLDVSEVHIQDTQYFGKLDAWLKSGGYEALLHYLQHLNLAGFEPRTAPHTAALYDQMTESLNPMEQVWFDCLHSGRIPAHRMRKNGSVELLASDFIIWAKERNTRWQFTDKALGALLGENPRATRRAMGFQTERIPPKNGPRYKIIPPLAEARRLWNELRFAVEWPGTTQRDFDGEQWEVFNIKGL